MDNYYELFQINKNASTKDIINAYENKINYYNNNNLSDKDILNIKIYKKGLYILTNSKLRGNYDKLLFNKYNVIAENDNDDLNNLDDLFNIDKSWMKNINELNDVNSKKQTFENNLSDRIFDVSFINNRPGYSTESEIKLRIPKQGRVFKS